MMNMMTGAVAINGGVGVMEIHHPQVAVSQMAASAAQAAEQVALNAHITLRELKGMIDTVVEKKLPTFKTLMEMNPVAVARTSMNGAKLTAYENGYAVYEVDSAHTVMAVERCGDYRYDFTDGTHQIVPAETFEEAEWSLRLLMEGEKRILNATQDLLWEEEFDVSKEDALSYFHPCAEIINTLGLKQKKYDGYYYDESGVLTAFDTDLTKQKAGLIIWKEALDKFLNIKNLHLVWFINASKEIHGKKLMVIKFTDWTGLLEYTGNSIQGGYYSVGKKN